MNKYKILSILLAAALLCTGLFMNPADAIAYRKQKLINILSDGYKPVIPNTHSYIRVGTMAHYGEVEEHFSQYVPKGFSSDDPDLKLPKSFYTGVGNNDVIVWCQYIGDVDRQFEDQPADRNKTGFDGKGRFTDFYLVTIKRGEMHDHSIPLEYFTVAYIGGKHMIVDRPDITVYLDDKPITKEDHQKELERWKNTPQ